MPNFESPTEGLPGRPRLQKAKSYVEAASAQPAAPVREGLPPSYRMRADPHYVDLLASLAPAGRERMLAVQAIDAPALADPPTIAALVDSIRRNGVLQPLLVQQRDGAHRLISGHKRLSAAVVAGLRKVPCLVFDVADDEAARLAEAAGVTAAPPAAAKELGAEDTSLHAGADLARSFATLAVCADLLSGSQSDLSRTVVSHLIRAEVWRATCLLHATRIVRRELSVSRSAASVAGILERVQQGFLPERRVRPVEFDATSEAPHGAFLAGDESMLATALGCAVLATIALFEGRKDARLKISAALEPAGHVSFAVSQEVLSVPEAWSARAFDHRWVERPGGVPVAIAMLAVKQTAETHGGFVEVTTVGGGTRIAIAVPAGV